MTGLQTDHALLAAMRESSARGLSAEEAKQQRISFVMGSLSDKNKMTREQVQNILDRPYGESKVK